jgi:hypothetical protein
MNRLTSVDRSGRSRIWVLPVFQRMMRHAISIPRAPVPLAMLMGSNAPSMAAVRPSTVTTWPTPIMSKTRWRLLTSSSCPEFARLFHIGIG